jgi:hypothetical protein
MKMFSDCSGPCKTCKINYIGGCLAGHGDNDYCYASPEWIKEKGLKYQEEHRIEIAKRLDDYEKWKNQKSNKPIPPIIPTEEINLIILILKESNGSLGPRS